VPRVGAADIARGGSDIPGQAVHARLGRLDEAGAAARRAGAGPGGDVDAVAHSRRPGPLCLESTDSPQCSRNTRPQRAHGQRTRPSGIRPLRSRRRKACRHGSRRASQAVRLTITASPRRRARWTRRRR
jgi:hypothetical protein